MSIKTPYIELSSLDLDNHVINGDMRFNQRYASTAYNFSGSGANPAYSLDRMRSLCDGTTGTKTFAITRDTDVPTFIQSNTMFPYSYKFTNGASYPTFADDDLIFPLTYLIEGNDYIKLHGRVITLSFWIKSNNPGVYVINLSGGSDFSRSYLTNFTIVNSATWEFKTVTVQLESGLFTYSFNNQYGLEISIGVAGGSNFTSTLINQWQTQADDIYTTPTAANILSSAGNYFNITGLKVNTGRNAAPFTLANKTFSAEYAACQRYYESSFPFDIAPQFAYGSAYLALNMSFVSQFNLSISDRISYRAQKNVSPSVLFYSQTNNDAKWLFYAAASSEYGTTTLYLNNQNGFNIQFVSGNFLGCSGNWSAESEL